MGTQDISRASFDRNKRYTSVRMQQGRVLVDDDWNENQRIAGEDKRISQLHIIGAAGSPDQGFQISNPSIVGSNIDFDIADGSFYLGGMRLTWHGKKRWDNDQLQTFLTQEDFLQLYGDLPVAPAGEQRDMVVLLAYEQPVSAVEDSELLEVALGGPDTTTRTRLIQQILVFQGLTGPTCEEAWEELQAQLQTEGYGSLLDETYERTTDAELKVGYTTGTQTSPDLCSPQAQSGYTGPENQAIRVQIVEGNKLTWGFDNAAPLYRVKLEADNKTLTMLTPPKDQAHWPLAQQVVELLPWSAVLPNGEKIAGYQGHLTKVDTSYNPDTQQFTVDVTAPDPGPIPDLKYWSQRSDQAALAQPEEFLYMRVWNRGDDFGSSTAITFTPGQPVSLGNTGLEVTLQGTTFLAGDHWIIAARPDSPQQVVPWTLQDFCKPEGIRRFITPLAMIHWNEPDNTVVYDCRPRFRPLLQQNHCCTFTVGDGKQSHGDYNSLEQAVQQLPPEGGKICVLPGHHEANVSLTQKKHIRITGCGPGTRILPKAGSRVQPVFRVEDCEDIILEGLDIISFEGIAVEALATISGLLKNLTCRHNRIIGHIAGIDVGGCTGLTLQDNNIHILDKDGSLMGIHVDAAEAHIQNNQVMVVPATNIPSTLLDGLPLPLADPLDPNANLEDIYNHRTIFRNYTEYIWQLAAVEFYLHDAYQALGGIQLASGARHIYVENNQIVGGAGHGITLGSFLAAPPSGGGGTPAESASTFETLNDSLQGTLTLNGDLQAEIPIFLVHRQTQEVYRTVADAQGRWVLNDVVSGRYDLHVADTQYSVNNIVPSTFTDRPTNYEVQLATATPSVSTRKTWSFLYRIVIQHNRISRMGQSGIGVPYEDSDTVEQLMADFPHSAVAPLLGPAMAMFGLLSGFTLDLKIQHNHITECLQTPFDQQSSDIAEQNRGVGGISLGFCSEVTIANNHILDNGETYLGPAHGIFVAYGQALNISHNRIQRNGSTTLDAMQQGSPGGITVYLATPPQGIAAPLASQAGSPALHLHDNIVEQPLGRALTAHTLGPVSITNNLLSTGLAKAIHPTVAAGAGQDGRVNVVSGQSSVDKIHPIADVAGTIFVYNLGISSMQMAHQYDPQAPVGDGTTGSPLHSGLMYTERVSQRSLPVGSLLFTGNQIRLGDANQSYLSTVLYSSSDISFHNNQCDVRTINSLSANVLLLGATVNAGNNRLKEPLHAQDDIFISLLTVGLQMNATTSNVGNHCTLAQSSTSKLQQDNNLSFISSQCSTSLAPVSNQTQTTTQTLYTGS